MAFRLSFVYENSSSHVRWWFDILSFVMKNIYEVLRQKELDVSRLKKELAALRVAIPLLSDESRHDDKPILDVSSAVNTTPQPDHGGWDDGAKRWP